MAENKSENENEGNTRRLDITSVIHPSTIMFLNYNMGMSEKNIAGHLSGLVRASMDATIFEAMQVDYPDDFTTVAVKFAGDLTRIAIQKGLLIYQVVDEINEDDNIQKLRFYAIDSSKKIAYINVSKSKIE